MRALLAALVALHAGAAAAHGVHQTDHGPRAATPRQGWTPKLITPAEAATRMTVDQAGGQRIIAADGLPDHQPGQFPNRGNPNAVRAQNYTFHMPLVPRRTTHPTPYARHPFGIALNGVVFDPGTAEFWNNDPRSGWNVEALGGAMDLGLDRHNAHVQPSGAYHYHALPTGILERLPWRTQPALIGYAADGHPIYAPFGWREAMNPASGIVELKPSWRLKQGRRENGPPGPYNGAYTQDYEFAAGSGDLDPCNGRTAATPEYPQGTYHYVLTAAFPFIPRCYMGAPDPSFTRAAGGPPPHRQPGGRPPR
jgi:hypothetical protein